MNPVVWEASKRSGWLFNANWNLVIGIPLIVPLAAFICDLILSNNMQHTKTAIQTIVASIFGYIATDRLIDAFKDDLRNKGLFGRDLNKAGEQKDKEPV